MESTYAICENVWELIALSEDVFCDELNNENNNINIIYNIKKTIKTFKLKTTGCSIYLFNILVSVKSHDSNICIEVSAITIR